MQTVNEFRVGDLHDLAGTVAKWSLRLRPYITPINQAIYQAIYQAINQLETTRTA